MQPTDINHKERLYMADTATYADIMRYQGMAQMYTLGPQKAAEALYDIQWEF